VAWRFGQATNGQAAFGFDIAELRGFSQLPAAPVGEAQVAAFARRPTDRPLRMKWRRAATLTAYSLWMGRGLW
jgi:hypothetical protein